MLSKKDRLLLLLACVMTTVIISTSVTLIVIECVYGTYAKDAAKYSKEARDAMHELDPSMIPNIEEDERDR